MFKRLFGDSGANVPSAQLERIRRHRASILSFARDDLARVKRQVSSDDRERLEAHISGIRDVEKQLEKRLGRGHLWT